MMHTDTFLYKDESYDLLLKEGTQIFRPQAYGVAPAGSQRKGWDYHGEYGLDGYQLLVNRLWIHSEGNYPPIKEAEPAMISSLETVEYAEYNDLAEPVAYTGGIVIARDFVYGFGFTGDYPCFCYKNVLELIFENGRLVTTIDHKKAMVRIRKNLKLGLRDLKKGKDARCIRGFLRTALVGHYRDSFLRKSMKLAKSKVKGIVKKES